MPSSKILALLVSTLALVCCNSGETEGPQRQPTAEATSVGTPIKPHLEDVRFYERPKLLEKLRSEGGPLPEVIYIESDPWLSVMGSDSPRFALYDDGLTIYREGASFRSVRLNAEELRSLRASLSEVRKPELEGGYRVARATDQPDNDLLLYRGEPAFLSVYGSLDDQNVTTRLPTSVRAAFSYVRSFRNDRAVDWMPEKIEVMVWPYENAPDDSIYWPSDWPGLSDSSTRKRGDSYSIFLPSEKLEALKAFLGTRRERGAVLMGGKKWSASFRIPFQSEELWMAPNLEVITDED